MTLLLLGLLGCGGDDTTAPTDSVADTGTATTVTDTGTPATDTQDSRPPPPDSGTPVAFDGGYEGTVRLTLSLADPPLTDSCEGPLDFKLAHFKTVQVQGGFQCEFLGELASRSLDPAGGLVGGIGAGGALAGTVSVHVIEDAAFDGVIAADLSVTGTIAETVYELLDSETGAVLETWTLTGDFTAQGEPPPPPG